MNEQVDPSLREKLSDEIGRSAWKDLRPHAIRGQLIFVDVSLDLLEVGLAIAEDRSEDVTAWVDKGLLKKLDPTALEQGDAEKPWHEFVIVQPFVLARRIDLEMESD